jgi:hypothetical protein
VCSGGTCTNTCINGQTFCNGNPPYCANTQTDNNNCGSCGNVCGQGLVCSNGTCTNSCVNGQTFCNANPPYCANTQTDNANCGSCATVCQNNLECLTGSCGCKNPLTKCSNMCVNTQQDRNNCGSCGNVCGQGLVCSNGTCTNTCLNGQTFCNANPPYCANTQTDNANCGGCGTVCQNNLECVTGACGCKNTLTNCNSSCVDTQSDSNNCGGCGTVCGNNQACKAGVCQVVVCTPSGSRAAFNTLQSKTTTGCWNGNVCALDNWTWNGTGQSFQNPNENIVCSGTTACVGHVGIGTYSSVSNCQGAWDVYCDGSKVGTINTVGKTCTGSAMTNGCSSTFAPVTCSTIKVVAASAAGPGGCCNWTNHPDSMIVAVSAW